MIRYAKPAAGLTAATLAGVAIGVTLTVYLAGWTGTVPALAGDSVVPAWVGTAEAISMGAGLLGGLSALAWVAIDYTDAGE